MKLGLITQVRDEIDIIRAFCSHTDALFDRVYLVDHQSVDGTGKYLKSIIAGKPGWRYFFLDSKTKIQTAVGNFVMKQAFEDGVDALFFLDADEFLLAPSRKALEDSVKGLPGDECAGSITWKNCIREEFEPPVFSFNDPLWVPPLESKFAKLVVPRGLYERHHGQIRVTDGNHKLVHTETGGEISSLRIGSMLHVPIRSRDQVVKKVILTVIAYRGYSLRIPGNAFQYYEMLEKIMRGQVSDDDLRGYTLGFEAPNLGSGAVERLTFDGTYNVSPRPLPDGKGFVPPRAQAAHQQAAMLVQSVCRRLRGKPLPEYFYRDYGSLVALGRFSTVGNLMGALTGGSIMIEGTMARLVYWSLHKMHEIALHGWIKTSLTTYAHFISTPTRARIKLH
mgnify:CR=1 FL=1